MIRKIVPFLLPVVALLGGAFGGDMLRNPAPAEAGGHDAVATSPEKEHASDDHAPDKPASDDHAAAPADPHAAGGDHGKEAVPSGDGWFTFPTQFFVPLVRQGDMRDIMILTLTLQTDAASADALAKKEHALRDALLRALMIHANTGGFDGNFTADRNLVQLRENLLNAAQAVTDLPLTAVLIEDIARQAG